MTDFPSTSLVKMPSKRVAELCEATIARCAAARYAELEPFETKITEEIARRAASTRRWFRESPDRDSVIRRLCSDWSWSLNYMFALEAYQKHERKAERLLAATKEAEDVWVSVDDLWAVSP